MRRLLSSVALAALMLSPVFAQTRGADPTGTSKRYFQLSGEIMDDPSADAFLIETRQGSRVTSAQLDVCFALPSGRKDRFVVELKPEDDVLAGTGTSQEEGVAIVVRLEREAKDNTVDYEGTITRGTSELSFSSADNAAISADEFRNSQSTDGNIVTNPANFAEVSPEAIFVRVERRATLDLVKSLRAENVKLTLDSLVQDCAALRGGSQLVRIEVDPQRAPALVAKLRGISGVVQAGWTHGTYSLENAVALDPAAWQGADARERLMTAVATAVAQFFKATAGASAWDAASGVTTLKFKRPNTTVPGLGFTDTIEVTATLSAEKPADGKRLVLWIGEASIATLDEGEGQRLGLITSSGNENDSGETINAAELTAAIARELKGQTWDTDRAAWK